jgi:hypothetical protein
MHNPQTKLANRTTTLTMLSILSVSIFGSTTDWIDNATRSEGDRRPLGRVEQIEVRGKVTGGNSSQDVFKATCTVETVSKKDAFARKLRIPNYIFGYGTRDSEQDAMRLLTNVALEIGGKTMTVPGEGVGDLARPEIPKLLFVFRKGSEVILEIGGPDGSEGYETQFVSDGSKFLYRMVRYEAGPNLKNYPSPLRTDF